MPEPMIPLKFPRSGSWPLALPALLALVLAACAQAPVAVVTGEGATGQPAREGYLDAHRDWAFSGRLAINNDGRAGNARIEWVQRGDDFQIQLSAPVTRQSWRLVSEAGQARLEGLDGGTRRGPDAEALLLEATGWRIPVQALADWVRGARADARLASLEFGARGLPSVLEEAGWTVEYRAWGEGAPPLPVRLFARRGDASVRLAIEHWSTP